MTTNDAAHFLFTLPVYFYANWLVLEAHGVFGIRTPKAWVEPLFLIILGAAIFFGDIKGYNGCSENGHMCKSINIMHMLFGIYMIFTAIVGFMLLYMRVFYKSVNFMSPIVLVCVGIFMMGHEQGSMYGMFIHTAFAYSCIVTAVLRAASLYDPQRWSVLCCLSATHTALYFMCGSDSMEDALGPLDMPHNVIFGASCLAMVLVMIPITIAYVVNKRRGVTLHLDQETPMSAEKKHMKDGFDIPLLNVNSDRDHTV